MELQQNGKLYRMTGKAANVILPSGEKAAFKDGWLHTKDSDVIEYMTRELKRGGQVISHAVAEVVDLRLGILGAIGKCAVVGPCTFGQCFQKLFLGGIILYRTDQISLQPHVMVQYKAVHRPFDRVVHVLQGCIGRDHVGGRFG